MEISELKAFVKVVQTGSFTQAAELLNTQRTYISRLINQLENKLDVRLLARTTRAQSLTEVGREFYERAVSILTSIEEAEQAVMQSQSQPTGILKLTCSTEFGMMAVGRWINEYLTAYPHMRVEADFTSRKADLVHEGFDLAIRVGELPDSSLVARLLGHVRYGLFASPNYMAKIASLSAPSDLNALHTISFLGNAQRTVWSLHHSANKRLQQDIELKPRYNVSNISAAKEAAINGIGIALLPHITAQAAIKDKQLVHVLPDWQPADIPVHAVFASARYVSPKVRSFIELAQQAMRQMSLELGSSLRD
ncbi:LysR family transcriptional regulator [Formosimonas limnophila]|uniref:LysR family transcriptional regulator n=1 Tax=Formosimonas limnophila TaxID=1384487 RepID=A0A8J3CJS4_9BURK|nr:LysR family transcriptional regulator [Formosimonas limnophila]GHA66431.1 LysR family transcriptional regulator [Formosimonas limnophila]